MYLHSESKRAKTVCTYIQRAMTVCTYIQRAMTVCTYIQRGDSLIESQFDGPSITRHIMSTGDDKLYSSVEMLGVAICPYVLDVDRVCRYQCCSEVDEQ